MTKVKAIGHSRIGAKHTGLVERVTYHNAENGFCVLRAKARGHRDVVTVVGYSATITHFTNSFAAAVPKCSLNGCVH